MDDEPGEPQMPVEIFIIDDLNHHWARFITSIPRDLLGFIGTAWRNFAPTLKTDGMACYAPETLPAMITQQTISMSFSSVQQVSCWMAVRSAIACKCSAQVTICNVMMQLRAMYS